MSLTFLRTGMTMKRVLQFLRRDEGLTTVEWVVLCAVVLIAALAISNTVMTGAGNLGGSVANKMTSAAGS